MLDVHVLVLCCRWTKLYFRCVCKLQTLVYDILPSLEEGARKRCSECGVYVVVLCYRCSKLYFRCVCCAVL